jgi:hypothetical protein
MALEVNADVDIPNYWQGAHYSAKLKDMLVLPPGYDPGSSDFQSVAMTTSAKAAKKKKSPGTRFPSGGGIGLCGALVQNRTVD